MTKERKEQMHGTIHLNNQELNLLVDFVTLVYAKFSKELHF